jgi:hypothetical protein
MRTTATVATMAAPTAMARPSGTNPFFEPGADDWLGEFGRARRSRQGEAGNLVGQGERPSVRPFRRLSKASSSKPMAASISASSAARTRIRDLADAAWRERHVVSVITVSAPEPPRPPAADPGI